MVKHAQLGRVVFLMMEDAENHDELCIRIYPTVADHSPEGAITPAYRRLSRADILACTRAL